MKWTFIASTCALIIIVLGKGFFGSDSEQELLEFKAQFPTKDSCLSGGAERIAKCNSPGCYNGVNSFMQKCLKQADGEIETFCNGIYMFQDSQQRDIFPTHCEAHTPYEGECDKVMSYSQMYCGIALKWETES